MPRSLLIGDHPPKRRDPQPFAGSFVVLARGIEPLSAPRRNPLRDATWTDISFESATERHATSMMSVSVTARSLLRLRDAALAASGGVQRAAHTDLTLCRRQHGCEEHQAGASSQLIGDTRPIRADAASVPASRRGVADAERRGLVARSVEPGVVLPLRRLRERTAVELGWRSRLPERARAGAAPENRVSSRKCRFLTSCGCRWTASHPSCLPSNAKPSTGSCKRAGGGGAARRASGRASPRIILRTTWRSRSRISVDRHTQTAST